MADLNNLNGYVGVIPQPYLIPRYYMSAPTRADTFDVFHCQAIQRGQTTLDTYFAPDAPGYKPFFVSKAMQGNGMVFAGNAPTGGIYTGIQQE